MKRALGVERAGPVRRSAPTRGASPVAVRTSRMRRRSALARSRQVLMPHGESRRSRRPAMPVISVTASRPRTASSSRAVEDGHGAERLARVADELGQGPRPGDPDRHRHAHRIQDPCPGSWPRTRGSPCLGAGSRRRRTRRSSNTRPPSTGRASRRAWPGAAPRTSGSPASRRGRRGRARAPPRSARPSSPPPPSSRSSWR